MTSILFSVAESCPETYGFGLFFFYVIRMVAFIGRVTRLPQQGRIVIKQKGNSRINIIFLGGFPGLDDVSQVQESK